MLDSALNTQIGGNHYAIMNYQPINLATKLNLTACQFSVLKYVSRYKNKNGLQDLAKASHFCDIGNDIDKSKRSFISKVLHFFTTRHIFLEDELRHYCSVNGMSILQHRTLHSLICDHDYKMAKIGIIELMRGEDD